MSKRDRILAGLAIITVALVFLVRPDMREVPSEQETYKPLTPDLKDKLNAIDEIVVSRGDQVSTLIKDDKGEWSVKEAYGYPASSAAIRKMLLFLSQSEIRVKKTDDPEKLERIGLSEERAYHISLKTGDEELYHVILGQITRDGSSTYVLLNDGTTQSYVTSGRLEFRPNPNEWLLYDLFSISRNRVKEVDYQFEGKKNYTYARKKPEDTMEFSPLPADRQLKQRQIPFDASIYFERMQFTDVLPASKKTGDSKNVTTLHTFDGLVLKVAFHEIDYRFWAEFKAEVQPQLRDETIKDIKPLEEVRAEAQAINQRTSGWLYELGQFQHNQLRRSYFEIVEDKPANSSQPQANEGQVN